MQALNLDREQQIHTFDHTHSLGHTFSDWVSWLELTTKYYILGDLNIRDSFSHCSVGQKSNINVLAAFDFSEAFLIGMQMATFSVSSLEIFIPGDSSFSN